MNKAGWDASNNSEFNTIYSLLRSADNWMEHKSDCKTYASNAGGSSYDADDESACSCGLNDWKKRLGTVI